MVTTIFPTLWPEVSALCASRNWLKWNFRMGGTEILPPSIQLWSCFKIFLPCLNLIWKETPWLQVQFLCNYQIPSHGFNSNPTAVWFFCRWSTAFQGAGWIPGLPLSPRSKTLDPQCIRREASVVKPSWRWDASERRVLFSCATWIFPKRQNAVCGPNRSPCDSNLEEIVLPIHHRIWADLSESHTSTSRYIKIKRSKTNALMPWTSACHDPSAAHHQSSVSSEKSENESAKPLWPSVKACSTLGFPLESKL